MTNTLVNVDKKIELPVAEEMQMGMTLGMLMEDLCQSVFILDGIFYYLQ